MLHAPVSPQTDQTREPHQPDWENHHVLHRNRLPARARFAAYPDEATARSGASSPSSNAERWGPVVPQVSSDRLTGGLLPVAENDHQSLARAVDTALYSSRRGSKDASDLVVRATKHVDEHDRLS